MQWLLLSVKIQKMISVWWFANKVTYHIDAERNPTGSIVGRTSNNEERSYHKMEVSNNYSTAKLWGTSDKKVSKSSEKIKVKRIVSEKIVWYNKEQMRKCKNNRCFKDRCKNGKIRGILRWFFGNCASQNRMEKGKKTALTSLKITTEKIEKQNRKLKCENTF